MIDLLRKLLPIAPGTFLDVGANLGQTLIKVSAIEDSRHYVGFEPNSACVAYLEQLIRANGLASSHIIPAGLSDQTGIVDLHLRADQNTDMAATIIPEFRGHGGSLNKRSVVVLGAKDISDRLPDDTSIIKIDVEGAELEVIRTLHPVIMKTRPHLIVEILPPHSEGTERSRRQEEIEGLMRGAGYSIFRIEKAADNQLARMQPISTIGVHNDMRLTDYLFAPRELPQRFLEGGV